MLFRSEALKHCVASYSYKCSWGTARIWSLRRRCELSYRAVMTVEVHPATRTVVQAKGFKNKTPLPKHRQLLAMWAQHAGLKLAV